MKRKEREKLCEKCAKRNICRKICNKLEAKLPKLKETVIHGRHRSREKLCELMWKLGRTKIILQLRDCLQGREREVIDLIFNESLTIEKAAGAMKTSEEGARRILKRAVIRMAKKLVIQKRRRKKHERIISG